jgi:hypothetical protein
MARRAVVCLLATLAAVTMAASAMAQSVELILSVAPSPLRTGAQATLQVQIVATEQLSGAVLSASAPSGISFSQSRMTLGRVRPPSTASTPTPTPSVIQPNPPLGVVPLRNFRLSAAQAGDYDVTVTLSYDGGSVSRSLTIQAR